MSQFIDYEAMDTDSSNLQEEEDQEDHENDQESSFIDDNTVFTDQASSNYRFVKGVKNFEESLYTYAKNVSISYEEAMVLKLIFVTLFLIMILFLRQKKNLMKLKLLKAELKNLRKVLIKNVKKSKDIFLTPFCGELILK